MRIKTIFNRKNAFASLFPTGQKPTALRVAQALIEMASNGIDAGATRVDIQIEEDTPILVGDNGIGFSDVSRRGYFEFFQSHKAGDPRFIGEHGTGRMKALAFGKKLDVFSVDRDDPSIFWATSLDTDTAWKVFNLEQKDAEWTTPKTLPSDIQLSKGTSGTVVRINLSKDAWESFPKHLDEIAARMSDIITPPMAKILRFNGKPLPSKPVTHEIEKVYTLQAIEALIGAEAAKQLGECSVHLYLPDKFDKEKDPVRIGGKMQLICKLTDFLIEMGNHKAAQLVHPALRSDLHVGGHISVTGLAKFRSESSTGLKAEIWKGFHLHLMKFLTQVLGPDVEREYTKMQTKREKERRSEELVALASNFRRVFGSPRRSNIVLEQGIDSDTSSGELDSMEDAPFTVNRKAISVIVGEQMDFFVSNFGELTEKDFIWDTSDLCEIGVISTQKGSSTRFAAERTGRGTLTVYHKSCAKHQVEIVITVVDEKPMQISPPGGEIPQGEDQRLRVLNSGSTSKNIRWEIVDPVRGLALSNTEGVETRLQVGASCPTGTYRVRCFDTRNKGIKDEARFTVVPQDFARIQIDDDVYLLRDATSEQSQPVLLQAATMFPRSDAAEKLGTAEIAFDDPVLKDASPELRAERIVHHILLQHFFRKLGEHAIEEPSEIPTLMLRFQRKLSEGKKK